MRRLRMVAVVVVVVGSALAAFGQQQNDELDEQITQLIMQLDADKFLARENAERELLRIGKPAIAELRRATKTAKGELKTRCRRILAKLDRSIRHVETVRRAELKSVVSTSVSSDGKFLYSAAFQVNSLCVFSRDKETGRLKHLQTLTDPDLQGAVCLRLSDDGKLAAASSFTAKTVTLFERNADSGLLTKKFTFKSDDDAPPIAFPCENAFSPDSRFLFVLDAYGRSQGATGAIIVLKVTENSELEWVETNSGNQSCFSDARGIAFRPGKNQFYVAASTAGAIVTVSWDKETGKLTINQDLRDEQNGVKGLAGAMSVAVSKDGKFAYTSSGRFRGDSSVGVFSIQDDGTLKVIQELLAGRDQVGEFLGGNELLVSQDGKNVYVTGTRSATLVGFSRDADSGKLEFVESVQMGGNQLGPAGIAIAPNGKYIYVAVEGDSGIAVFRREL